MTEQKTKADLFDEFARRAADWLADRRQISEREDAGEASPRDWHISDDTAADIVRDLAQALDS